MSISNQKIKKILEGHAEFESATSKSEAWRSNPIELLARDQDIIGLGLDCKKIFFSISIL